MARKLVIDGRNLYTPQGMREKLRVLLLWPRVVFSITSTALVILSEAKDLT